MESKIPCRNPTHPTGLSPFHMICVKESATEEVWACKACMEINHTYSVQVKTKTKYQQHIRRELAKEGKLVPRPTTRLRKN